MAPDGWQTRRAGKESLVAWRGGGEVLRSTQVQAEPSRVAGRPPVRMRPRAPEALRERITRKGQESPESGGSEVDEGQRNQDEPI